MSELDEEVVQLDRQGKMVGILSTGLISKNAPVALMFNAGLLHRVGPFRLWVDLSRELAKKNIPSFRFDLAGLGDSPHSVENSAKLIDDSDQRALENVVEAMDYVESRMGKREFVILGLCSGADVAHPVAKIDSRIRKMIFIDGYGYATPGFYDRFRRTRMVHFLRRSLSLRAWINLIQRKIVSIPPSSADALKSLVERDFPDSEQIQSDILAFLKEDRRLCYIYTAGQRYLNAEAQFWEMFPKLKPAHGLSCHYYKNADHTFSVLKDRQDLMARMVQFILS